MKKIKSIPEFDRPREKMEEKGARALNWLNALSLPMRLLKTWKGDIENCLTTKEMKYDKIWYIA